MQNNTTLINIINEIKERIKSKIDKYQFLDIDTVSKVKIGDIVIFSGEIQNDEKKLSLLKKLTII